MLLPLSLICKAAKARRGWHQHYQNPVLLHVRPTDGNIIGFALKKGIADPLSFVKKTFTPDFDVSTLYEQEEVTIQQAQTNTDVFFQFDEFIKFKQRKVGKGTILPAAPSAQMNF